MKRQLKRWRRRLLRAARPTRLRNTWLHRVLGERLFDPHLWVPSRETLAAGLALGTFIALSPPYGVHMILAVLAAYMLRVNVPAAVATCWIVNPVTMVVIYPAEWRLGVALVSRPAPIQGLPRGVLHQVLVQGQALWVGWLVAGSVAALVVYGAALLSWRWIGRISPFHRRAVELEHRADVKRQLEVEAIASAAALDGLGVVTAPADAAPEEDTDGGVVRPFRRRG